MTLGGLTWRCSTFLREVLYKSFVFTLLQDPIFSCYRSSRHGGGSETSVSRVEDPLWEGAKGEPVVHRKSSRSITGVLSRTLVTTLSGIYSRPRSSMRKDFNLKKILKIRLNFMVTTDPRVRGLLLGKIEVYRNKNNYY